MSFQWLSGVFEHSRFTGGLKRSPPISLWASSLLRGRVDLGQIQEDANGLACHDLLYESVEFPELRREGSKTQNL